MIFRDKVIRGNLEIRLGRETSSLDWLFLKAAVVNEVYSLLEKYDISYEKIHVPDLDDSAVHIAELDEYADKYMPYFIPRHFDEEDSLITLEFLQSVVDRVATYLIRNNYSDTKLIVYPNVGFKIC